MTGDLFWMPAVFLGGPVAIAWAYALYWTFRARKRASQGSLRRKTAASLMLVVLLIAGFLFVAIAPLWFRASVPWFVIRRSEIRLLSVVEIVYGVTILTATVALVPLLVIAVQRRNAKRVRLWAMRALALAFSLLAAALAAEGLALAALWANSIPMPWLPTRFDDRPGEKVVDILVVGESSARGVPYDQWFSVADIVAWKLQGASRNSPSVSRTRQAPGFPFRPCTHCLAAFVGALNWSSSMRVTMNFSLGSTGLTERSITPTKRLERVRRFKVWLGAFLR